MPMTKDQLLAEAFKLPPEELAQLAEDLRQRILSDDLDPEFSAELRRRIAEIDRGDAEGIPVDQAIRELSDRLRRTRSTDR